MSSRYDSKCVNFGIWVLLERKLFTENENGETKLVLFTIIVYGFL